MRRNARLPKELGKRIRKRRKALKLSQEELATRARISPVYMGYIEQGRNTPSLEVLQKIAKALGISMSELFSS